MKNKLHFNIMTIVALSFMLLASFCKKADTGIITSEAKVYNSGPVALDGCGWFLRVDSTKEYSPLSLPDDFMVGQGMKVTVRYRLLNTDYQCGWGAKLKQIEILDIKRKDPIALPTQATIINTSTTLAEGCGWLVKVDSTYYSPNNLPPKYRVNNMQVKMAFIKTNFLYQCDTTGTKKYYRIDIRDIQPK